MNSQFEGDREFSPAPIRTVLAAADPLARSGLRALLEGQPELRLVSVVDLALDSVESLADLEADVVVIDLGWDSESDSAAALESWREIGVPLLLLVEVDPDAGWPAQSGAASVLARDRDGGTIRLVLQAIVRGLRVTDPRLGAPAPRPVPIPEPLTARELQVLRLLADGRSNRAIGQELAISEHTVKFHVTSILAKLGAESRTEAAVLGVRAGLIAL